MDQQGIVSARGTFYYGIMEEEISTHGLADVESQILVRSWRATRESQGQHSQEYRIAYRASFFFLTLSQSGIILTFGTLLLLTSLSLPLCETSDIKSVKAITMTK